MGRPYRMARQPVPASPRPRFQGRVPKASTGWERKKSVANETEIRRGRSIQASTPRTAIQPGVRQQVIRGTCAGMTAKGMAAKSRPRCRYRASVSSKGDLLES